MVQLGLRSCLIFLLSFFVEVVSYSQVVDVDTVYVNESGVTFIFPSDVSLAITNLAKDYFVESKGSIVKINAKNRFTRTTILTVQYGDSEDIFTTVICYRAFVDKMLFNFKKSNKKINVVDENKIRDQMVVDSEKLRVKMNLDNLLDYKDEIQTVGTKIGNIVFNLSSLRIDAKYIYFMFLLSNQTNLDFNIDYVRFQAVDKFRYDESYTDNNDSELVPFVSTGVDVVKRNSSDYITYCIPVFGVSSKGGYKVTLKEKAGNRKPVIIIRSKIIETAKFLN